MMTGSLNLACAVVKRPWAIGLAAAAVLMALLHVTVFSPHRRFHAVALSQFGEDEALNAQFFQGETGGVFVEMGALDGRRFSNTYAFENSLGWSGVLIEANPASCEKLFQNRQRPTTRNLCTAVSSDSAPITFNAGKDPAVFASQSQLQNMSQEYKNIFHQVKAEVTVPSAPLGYLLRASGIKYIDLFSLDVEGSEMIVLDSMDWSIPVRVWCIEVENHMEGDSDIERLLLSKGYTKVGWDASDIVGAHMNALFTWAGPERDWEPDSYTWHPYVPLVRSA